MHIGIYVYMYIGTYIYYIARKQTCHPGHRDDDDDRWLAQPEPMLTLARPSPSAELLSQLDARAPKQLQDSACAAFLLETVQLHRRGHKVTNHF